jgi:UDP-N-acetylmuramoyl-L-alanyl-D-glutamate--2,6-diaminopimelate ligase
VYQTTGSLAGGATGLVAGGRVAITLGELVRATPGARLVAGDAGQSVESLTHDSRCVGKNALFVALPGQRFDGTAFVPDAVRRGAVAVVSEQATPTAPVAWVVVPAARPALAEVAAAWHGNPSERLRLIGVTGTDGKTTTTRLIAGLLEAGGRRCGWYTTTDLKIGSRIVPNDEHHTTPEADRVQEVLADIVRGGCDVAVLEASSHALAQERLRRCAFDVAVFTNLSPEHLNYHGSLDAYLAAKARLFEMLGEPTAKAGARYAVLNADDPASERMRAACPVRVLTYSLQGRRADVRLANLVESLDGVRLTVEVEGRRWPLRPRYIGQHNAYNWLAAVTVALQEGVPVPAMQAAAWTIEPPPGRLQCVRREPFGVYVDFAHTPGALRAVLGAMRRATTGRVLLAFGQAGGRMAENRPVMGALAAELADYFVITSDDSYPEDPVAIAAEVEAGAREAGAEPGRQYAVCVDRRQAIRHLLERAAAGDLVLLAGKGHERTLRSEQTAISWSDAGVAAEILTELGYTSEGPGAG